MKNGKLRHIPTLHMASARHCDVLNVTLPKHKIYTDTSAEPEPKPKTDHS